MGDYSDDDSHRQLSTQHTVSLQARVLTVGMLSVAYVLVVKQRSSSATSASISPTTVHLMVCMAGSEIYTNKYVNKMGFNYTWQHTLVAICRHL